MTEVTLEFIAKQLERVLAEQAAMRDEMLVLGASMSRVEAGVAVIAAEVVHALNNQFGRMMVAAQTEGTAQQLRDLYATHPIVMKAADELEQLTAQSPYNSRTPGAKAS